MKIITFLGNPGRKYKKTRHNAGFIIGEILAEEFNINIGLKKFHSMYGRGRARGNDVVLVFPQTYMNKSGVSVNEVLQFFNEVPDNLLVVHDEIELPFGEIKVKAGGGHKGHNGLRSIIQNINSAEFTRIRIGVGRPGHPDMEVADYLLSGFSKEEYAGLTDMAPEIIDIILTEAGK
ncbi:MAG: aminoacyl-tRNA hydrolase [Spirochaetes bacterium]|nr:aminoacyl-tRNA hydrolase [Spirochaetota bacterium]